MNLKKYKKKIRKYRFLRIITWLLLIITLFYTFVLLFSNLFLNNIISSAKYELDSPKSFLLIGSDYREQSNSNIDGARADTLVVITLSPNNERNNIEFNAISIPRDTLTLIPCGPSQDYYDKINSSLNFGLSQNEEIQDGIDCTVQAVEFLLNIDIDNYMMATFDGLISLIDSIDGISINSPYEFCEQDNNGNGYSENGACLENSIKIEKGLQTMDGQTALAYARQRHLSSDYERNLRQQQVIMSIGKKVLTNPTKYGVNLIKSFNNNFYTDISTNDIWNYINFATTIYNNILLNLENNIPVYIDLKSSEHENIQTNLDNAISDNNYYENITPQNANLIYENVADFEKETSVIHRQIFKEDLNLPSNLSLHTKKNMTIKPFTIELSSFSIASTELNIGGAYSYFDYDSLYYTSNLLRKSLNQEISEPTYDYSEIGIDPNASNDDVFVDPNYNDEYNQYDVFVDPNYNDEYNQYDIISGDNY